MSDATRATTLLLLVAVLGIDIFVAFDVTKLWLSARLMDEFFFYGAALAFLVLLGVLACRCLVELRR